MATKVAAALTTMLIVLAAAAVVLLFMLVAMNGFSERDATWGLVAYGSLVLLFSLLAGVLAAVLAGWFTCREMGGFIAAVLSTLVCSVIGAVLVVAGGFAGVLLAEMIRRNR